MKISDRSSLHPVQSSEAGKARRTQTAEAPQGGSTVTRLSSQAFDASEGVNMARVSELKQAIAEGRFNIDADKISQSLLQSAAELIG